MTDLSPELEQAIREALDAHFESGDGSSQLHKLVVRLCRQVSAEAHAQPRKGCINCGEANDGGYGIEDVGAFCSQCWEYLREHFAAEAHAEGRRAWQPIETAPRDGRVVILANFEAMCLLTGAPHVWTARFLAHDAWNGWAECS